MTNSNPKHPRGIALIELMSVLVILAAFTVIATPLFISALQTAHHARQTTTAIASFDSALSQLRRDLTSARAFTVLDPQRLSITLPDSTTITYAYFADDHLLYRITSADAPPNTWSNLPQSITFAQQGPLLALSVPVPNASPEVLLIPSPLQLAAGGQK